MSAVSSARWLEVRNPREEELTVAGWPVVCSLMSVGDDRNSHEQSGPAVLVCKPENEIGSGGEESPSEPKVIEVRGN